MAVTRISGLCAALSGGSIRRTIYGAARMMGEGDTGGLGRGGSAEGDSFTRREQASEAFYVRQHEAENLATLRKDIADHESRLVTMKDHAEAIRLEVDKAAEEMTPGP
ncbi:ATPase inhibitor [Friedmanniomyces endolithicus]|nr:ATPase inhibitor [Friedmanniomyces endolithicus]